MFPSPAVETAGYRNIISSGLDEATNGNDYWQARGSADWERRLAAITSNALLPKNILAAENVRTILLGAKAP